jgi:N6-adenosine-specific RNA methylase IME4
MENLTTGTELKIHPLAELLPQMPEAEYERFKADIAAEGLKEPIWVLNGQVVDGRHRWRACRELGIHPTTRELPADTDEPEVLRYILSENLFRRHLTESQRATIAARLETYRHGDNQHTEHLQLCITRSEAANKLNVSERSVASARVVLEHGATELVKAVEAGTIPVSTASVITELPPEEQAAVVAECRERGSSRPARYAAFNVRRREKYGHLADALDMDGLPLFSVVLADPPWQYQLGGMELEKEVENHYPCMPLEKIKDLGAELEKHLTKDALLFLWATVPLISEALEVMKAWGFEYRTAFAWVKARVADGETAGTFVLDGPGLGLWLRGGHEHLLIGVRGNFPTPSPDARVSSVILAPRHQHSRKPEEVYDIIEKMAPEVQKLEMFARNERPGWTSWGNQVGRRDDTAAA